MTDFRTDVVLHICVHNMAAEWNHCLSTDTIAALPPVTQAEYKLRYAPWAHTFMMETCEQTVWKAHKGTKRQQPMLLDYFLFFIIQRNCVKEERKAQCSYLKLDLFHTDVWLTFTPVLITLMLITVTEKRENSKDSPDIIHAEHIIFPSAPNKKLTSALAWGISCNMRKWQKPHTAVIETSVSSIQ